MKKYLFALALSLVMLQAFSQETASTVLSKEDYLKQSRRQKTAGWILLGGGVGLLAVSAATYKVNIDLSGLFGSTPSPSQVDNTGSTIAGIAGLAAITGGVVSLASAQRNKKKAAALTITNQQILLPRPGGLVPMMQPVVHLKIRL